MNYSLIILPLAKQDIKEINFNYKSLKKGLAEKFNNSLKNEIKIIHRNPYLYQTRYEDIRVALIEKFPYLIYFEIHKDLIVIHAIYHASRDATEMLSRE
jgi:plasmid stabilization system protein ParE